MPRTRNRSAFTKRRDRSNPIQITNAGRVIVSSYLQFPINKEFLVSIGDETHGKEAFERVMGVINNIERMLFGRGVNLWLLLRELKKIIASTKADEDLQVARAAAMWSRGQDRVSACAEVYAATGDEDDLWLLLEAFMRYPHSAEALCRALVAHKKTDLARQYVREHGGWATLAKFSGDTRDLSAAEGEIAYEHSIHSCVDLYVATQQSSWLAKAYKHLEKTIVTAELREIILAETFLPAIARVQSLPSALVEMRKLLQTAKATIIAYYRLAEAVGDGQHLEEAERMVDASSPAEQEKWKEDNHRISLRSNATLGVIQKLVADWKKTRDSSLLTHARGLFERIKNMGAEALVQVVKGHCALVGASEETSDEVATWGDALATLRQIELRRGLEPHGEASMAIVQSMLFLLNDSTPPDHRKTYFGRIREIAKAIGHHLWRCGAFLAMHEAQKKFEKVKVATPGDNHAAAA